MTSSPALVDERSTPIIHRSFKIPPERWVSTARRVSRKQDVRQIKLDCEESLLSQGAPQSIQLTSCIRWSVVGKGADGGIDVLKPANSSMVLPLSWADS